MAGLITFVVLVALAAGLAYALANFIMGLILGGDE